jgi:hypothetical protein
MGGGAFQALHNFNQWEGPAVFISQGCEQEVDMVGHCDSGKQINSPSALSHTVVQDETACFARQDQWTGCTKGHEEGHVKFVKVRKAATILIFLLDGHSVLLVLCNFISLYVFCQ